MVVKAKSWDDIENHYADLNGHGWGHDNLLKLVQHIKSSGISNRIFAYTSLDNLIVSIYEDIEWEKETLHIEFDRHTQKWNFKYFAKPYQVAEFVRQYDAGLGMEKFDDFINMMKW